MSDQWNTVNTNEAGRSYGLPIAASQAMSQMYNWQFIQQQQQMPNNFLMNAQFSHPPPPVPSNISVERPPSPPAEPSTKNWYQDEPGTSTSTLKRKRFEPSQFSNQNQQNKTYNYQNRNKQLKAPPKHSPKQQQQHGSQKPPTSNIAAQLVSAPPPASIPDATSNIQQPQQQQQQVVVNKKGKRKTMSTHYSESNWNREDAIKAIALEEEHNSTQVIATELILKFPDEELNNSIVKRFSKNIDQVHFQQPCTPRYCAVKLLPNVDVEATIAELQSIPFGKSFIHAERKYQKDQVEKIQPHEIDPYTLYVGNIPKSAPVSLVKQMYKKAVRFDMGYAKRMKTTRYAFIRFRNFEDAEEAFRNSTSKLVQNRSLIARFRRKKEYEPKTAAVVARNEEEPTNVNAAMPGSSTDFNDVIANKILQSQDKSATVTTVDNSVPISAFEFEHIKIKNEPCSEEEYGSFGNESNEEGPHIFNIASGRQGKEEREVPIILNPDSFYAGAESSTDEDTTKPPPLHKRPKLLNIPTDGPRRKRRVRRTTLEDKEVEGLVTEIKQEKDIDPEDDELDFGFDMDGI